MPKDSLPDRDPRCHLRSRANLENFLSFQLGGAATACRSSPHFAIHRPGTPARLPAYLAADRVKTRRGFPRQSACSRVTRAGRHPRASRVEMSRWLMAAMCRRSALPPVLRYAATERCRTLPEALEKVVGSVLHNYIKQRDPGEDGRGETATARVVRRPLCIRTRFSILRAPCCPCVNRTKDQLRPPRGIGQATGKGGKEGKESKEKKGTTRWRKDKRRNEGRYGTADEGVKAQQHLPPGA